MALKRYAVLNDVHFPYESKAYYKALKLVSEWNDLAGIYLNGDILEVESLSTHPKGFTAERYLKEEVDYANNKFDYIEKTFQGVPVSFIEGNHCFRFFRYIRDVAPHLWGLLDHPKLLRFDERGWKFHPYGPRQWVKCGSTRLWLRHEPLGGGKNPATFTAERSYVDCLFGHTHIHQIATCKKHGPVPYMVRAYSGGFLGDINQSVFDYRGPKDNWATGFNEIITDDSSDDYEYRFHWL